MTSGPASLPVSTTLRGGPGNDLLIGGPGQDLAVFTGPATEYRITVVGRFARVDHQVATGQMVGAPQPDGRDTLVDVELLQFSNGTVTIGSPAVPSFVGGFDARFYLVVNADVARAVGTADPTAFALAHWTTAGWREGRDPNAFFDTDWYLANNPDVARAGINPLDHYMGGGWRENRDPSPNFDTSAYLARHSDVRLAGLNPLEHFLGSGFFEDRIFFPAGA